MAHGGRLGDTDDQSEQGMYVRGAHALKESAKHSPGDKEEMDHYSKRAKEEAMNRSMHMHKLPKPKIKGLAKGGNIVNDDEGHSGAYHAELGKLRQSEKAARETGASKRSGELHTPEQESSLRKKHYGERMKLAKGGVIEDDEMKMHKMSPDVPSMHPKTMKDGGEVSDEHDDGDDLDQELSGMVADELFEAIEKKDKKGILDSIRALVMSCKGE